jgi:hypothetical protein
MLCVIVIDTQHVHDYLFNRRTIRLLLVIVVETNESVGFFC